MEALAFVEELDRDGAVLRRHAIARLPARIGRAYDNDVIVDDPHVAAHHLEIRGGEGGALEAVDLGSINGTYRIDRGGRIATTPIRGDDVFRIGQTQLRIRLPGQAVPPELPLRHRAWDRHPGVLAGSAAAFAGYWAWNAFLSTSDTDLSVVYSWPISISLAVLVWASIWSLICRTLTGHGNFVAHGIVAFAGTLVLFSTASLTEYIDFAFDLDHQGLAWTILAAGIFAAMLYRHLQLTIRLPVPLLVLTVTVLATLLFGGLEGYATIRNSNRPGLQHYDRAIKPGAFLFARGVAPGQFIEQAEKLKTGVDRDASAQKP